MTVLSVIFTVASLIYLFTYQTYHFVVVDPGKLYRDGNRSPREFKNALRRSNAKTVVAIIDEQEYNQAEFVEGRNIAKARGLEYDWIPVKAGAFPRPDQVRAFIQIAANPARQPVLYHDDEGIRRAGMMMAAYQESVLGYDNARAKAAIHAFGHSDRTIDDVRRFIDAYDPIGGLPYDLNRPTPSATAPTTESATVTTRPAGE